MNRFTAVCILLFILIMAGGGAQVVAEKSLQDTFLFLTFYSPDQVASKYIRFPKEERPKDHQLLILDLKPILYILGLASGEQDLVVELHYINRWARVAPGLAATSDKSTTRLASHKLLATLMKIDDLEDPTKGQQYLAVQIHKKKLEGIWQRRLKKKIGLERGEPCYLIFKNSDMDIFAYYPVICAIPFETSIPQLVQLNKLLRQQNHQQIKSYCLKLPNFLQQQGWRMAGDYFYKNNDLKRTGSYYRQGNHGEGLTTIGRRFLEQRDFQQALLYFELAGPSIWRARTLVIMADLYKTQQKTGEAGRFYTRGVREFETMAADFHYKFTVADNRERRRCIAETIRLSQGLNSFKEKIVLRDILKGLAAYCDKLDKEYFMFFCHEVIKDYVDFSLEFKDRDPIVNTFVYDYQLLKEKNRIKEQRILVEENGEKRNLKDARLFTNFQYENLVMGPQVLFSKNWQNFYDYRLRERQVVAGKTVYVIETIPKDLPSDNALMGKVWVHPVGNGIDILKIAWNGKTIIKNFKELINLEYLYGADLQVDFFLEFNLEKFGVRLPSKFFIEVAYQRGAGDRFVRSRSEVTFSNHKFFNVGTKVQHKNPEK